jgi:hypothetical protein
MGIIMVAKSKKVSKSSKADKAAPGKEAFARASCLRQTLAVMEHVIAQGVPSSIDSLNTVHNKIFGYGSQRHLINDTTNTNELPQADVEVVNAVNAAHLTILDLCEQAMSDPGVIQTAIDAVRNSPLAAAPKAKSQTSKSVKAGTKKKATATPKKTSENDIVDFSCNYSYDEESNGVLKYNILTKHYAIPGLWSTKCQILRAPRWYMNVMVALDQSTKNNCEIIKKGILDAMTAESKEIAFVLWREAKSDGIFHSFMASANISNHLA